MLLISKILSPYLNNCMLSRQTKITSSLWTVKGKCIASFWFLSKNKLHSLEFSDSIIICSSTLQDKCLWSPILPRTQLCECVNCLQAWWISKWNLMIITGETSMLETINKSMFSAMIRGGVALPDGSNCLNILLIITLLLICWSFSRLSKTIISITISQTEF